MEYLEYMDIPSGNVLQFAIEHGPFSSLIYRWNMLIYYSYAQGKPASSHVVTPFWGF
jgi:hypothetical protein